MEVSLVHTLGINSIDIILTKSTLENILNDFSLIPFMVKIDEDYEGEMFSSVVLDGTNIITERSNPDYIFRFERLQNAIRAVEELGWRTKTILKKGTYNNCLKESSTLTDNQKSALRKMNEFGIVHLVRYTGDKDRDDKIMIQHALDHNAWILTRDTFTKDHFKTLKEEKYATINEINKRKVRITWGGPPANLHTTRKRRS